MTLTFNVSIHAPTQGATEICLMAAAIKMVSIHAPTQGATYQEVHCCPKICRFNPRTHAGCDHWTAVKIYLHFVSIHAPTQGATESNMISEYSDNVSIHAPTQGAT